MGKNQEGAASTYFLGALRAVLSVMAPLFGLAFLIGWVLG
jgi:hypothetical protein